MIVGHHIAENLAIFEADKFQLLGIVIQNQFCTDNTRVLGEGNDNLDFFTNAALHDGAMVIREGRIAAAGCVLPLSESSRLSLDLGTRHRAAVGMSEISDAVVVVVSEETGAISVAIDGMLKRHLAPQTLERLLRNELLTEEKEEQKNLVLKLRQMLLNKEKGEKKNEK